MATYSDSQKKRIMEFPIDAVLQHFGKRTDHRGEMYFSPFRDESAPSFHVRRSGNLWMDFGSGQGGNVLTLVSLLAGIPVSECWDYVAGLDRDIVVPDMTSAPVHREGSPSRIVIDSVSSEFRCRNLIRYAESRGIPSHILGRYCSQVTYHLSGRGDARWTAIGFPAGDGWVLRHSTSGPFSKRCTGSACSLLGPAGESVSSASCDRVEVFEGFFDFLSWLVIRDRTKPFADICVLNSVNNLSRGLEFIASHGDVSCWLDSDEAGLKALERIRERCPSARDHLGGMEGCKDVNEYLIRTVRADVVIKNTTNNSFTLKK